MEVSSDDTLHRGNSAKKLWKAAALMTRGLRDPWAEIGFDEVEDESVTRHMYNPRNRKWKTDEVVVKMQSKVLTLHFMISSFVISSIAMLGRN